MNRIVSSSLGRICATQAARRLWLPASQATVSSRRLAVLPQSVRSFSALTDLLTREHTEEVDNKTTEMPPDLVDLKTVLEQEEGWKIVDDGAMTKLYRTLESNASKIHVTFHCQDTVEDDYVDEEEVMEDDEEPAVPIRFHVSISKAGKTLAMTCLTTEDLAASIQSVAVTSQLQDDYLVAASDYQGPEFTELAEDLQEAFHNYLIDEVGVSENLISFLSMYCDFKEQTMYVKFLSDAKSLLG